ncbi:MAG: hypothetical protein GOV02_01340 [Candidatus Aenigmarchaeota archaeon]|nr:hypothetical protein [Candidatus Aenigmarchaeota archaeon]
MVRKARNDWSFGKVLAAGVILLGAGFLLFMGPAQNMWSQYAPEEWRAKPEGVTEDSALVDLSIKLMHALDRGNPASTPIRVYDSDKNFVESASTSSGVASFLAPYWEGETIYLQVRAAAPNSATYVTYTTPLMEYVVPDGDVNGDAELPVLSIDETSTSVATFNIVEQGFATISTEATDFINTTDTQLTITVAITGDCVYGTPADFTDMDTNKHYLSGVFLVIKSTAAQPTLRNYIANFYSSSLQYYIFRIPMIVSDSDLGYQTARTFTIGDGATAFAAAADFDFDLFDTCWANSVADINENSFQNGDSDLNPTAVANKVA